MRAREPHRLNPSRDRCDAMRDRAIAPLGDGGHASHPPGRLAYRKKLRCLDFNYLIKKSMDTRQKPYYARGEYGAIEA